jgi:hypothetical protein
MAARAWLAGHAAPGDILLSPWVGRLVEGWFELRVREGPAGAELSDGVGADAVVGLGPRRSPLEVYGKHRLSRFVGRERELRHCATSPTMQVPATVQAVLAVRIDRLLPEAKRLLQTSSVIGHEVPLPLLQAIAELAGFQLHAFDGRNDLYRIS